MMAKSVSTGEAKNNLDDLLQSVRVTREPVVIEGGGEPLAVIITPADFARFLRLEAETDWESLDALAARNAHKDPDEAFTDITAEIEAARQERRAAFKRRA
jgi:prevent-host-death family protein